MKKIKWSSILIFVCLIFLIYFSVRDLLFSYELIKADTSVGLSNLTNNQGLYSTLFGREIIIFLNYRSSGNLGWAILANSFSLVHWVYILLLLGAIATNYAGKGWNLVKGILLMNFIEIVVTVLKLAACALIVGAKTAAIAITQVNILGIVSLVIDALYLLLIAYLGYRASDILSHD